MYIAINTSSTQTQVCYLIALKPGSVRTVKYKHIEIKQKIFNIVCVSKEDIIMRYQKIHVKHGWWLGKDIWFA